MLTLTRATVVAATLSLAIGCMPDQLTNSDISVAGGDVSKGAKFPSSVFVRMDATTIDGKQAKPIQNVGTFIDVGVPNYAVLLLPVANALEMRNGKAIFPAMRTMNITIHSEDRNVNPVSIRGLEFDDKGSLTQGVKFLAVGLALRHNDQVISSSPLASRIYSYIEKVKNNHLIADPVGERVGNQYTAYVLIGIPVSHDRTLLQYASGQPGAARLVTSEERAALNNMTMVGFGATEKDINVSQRNAASVSPLAQGGLASVLGQAVNPKVLFEIRGSALCYSAPGVDGVARSYDIGASVYQVGANGQNEFLGFGSRSASIQSGFKKLSDCRNDKMDDMATVVVSIPQSVKSEFVHRIQMQ